MVRRFSLTNQKTLAVITLLLFAVACSGDAKPRATPASEPSVLPATETPPPTPGSGAITVSPARPFTLTTLAKTPEAPSTVRDDPVVLGPQVLVYDNVTGLSTVASDGGVVFEGAYWLSPTQVWVRLGDRFAIYDAAARTWKTLDMSLALDRNSIGIPSADGSQAAIYLADRSLVLVDLRALTYRTVSLKARPVAWSPDSTRLLVGAEPAPDAPNPLYSLIAVANPGFPVQLPSAGLAPHFRPEYNQWLSNSRIIGIDQNPFRVLIVDVSSPTPRVVANEVVESGVLAVSPDRRLLAVSPGGIQSSPSVAIYSIEPFARLTEMAGVRASGGRFLNRTVWTSDSKRIVASRDTCTSNESLVLLDVGTGSETKVAEAAPYGVALSPDDRLVAYTAGAELYIVPSDGSAAARLLFQPTHAPVTPSWSPDGRFIAFVRYFGGYGRCP